MKFNLYFLMCLLLGSAFTSSKALSSSSLDVSVSEQDLVKRISARSAALEPHAHRLVKSASLERGIADVKHGKTFPLNPQVLNELMNDCEGKTVLEMGAAGGENSLLLLLAGANVIVNDITRAEVEGVMKSLTLLPNDLQKKCRLICCDCFKLAKAVEAHSVDILIARNLFHFFEPSQHEAFFSLVRTLLKPDGRLVMAANNKNFMMKASVDCSFAMAEPEMIKFSQHTLIFDVPGKNPSVQGVLFSKATEGSNLNEYKNTILIKHPYSKLIYNPELVPKSLYAIMEEQLTNNKALYLKAEGSYYRSLKSSQIMFTPANLRTIFEKHGFNPTATAHVDSEGRLFQAEDWSEAANKAILVSIIGTVSSKEESK